MGCNQQAVSALWAIWVARLILSTTLMASLGLVVSAAFHPSVAIAQGNSEEIIVSGRYGRVPDNAQTASQAVSYADLDL
jgi:hypothetical protein